MNLFINNTHLILDILIHVLILFVFLSIFFFMFVSKIEKKAFKDEMGGLIEKNITTVLDTKRDTALPIINEIRPEINTVKQLYASPDRYGQEVNTMIKRSCIFVAAILLAIILTILIFSKDGHLNIFGILRENIITFIFVGIVEYWFFTNIAIKFIPTTPSLMINTLYQSVDTNL